MSPCRGRDLDLHNPKVTSPSGEPVCQFRHIFATQLSALGGDPRAVRGMLGHCRIDTMLDVYAASVPSILHQVAERPSVASNVSRQNVG